MYRKFPINVVPELEAAGYFIIREKKRSSYRVKKGIFHLVEVWSQEKVTKSTRIIKSLWTTVASLIKAVYTGVQSIL